MVLFLLSSLRVIWIQCLILKSKNRYLYELNAWWDNGRIPSVLVGRIPDQEMWM